MCKKVKGFFEEFRTFAVRGNVVDLAVGVIIGGAFQKIVNSLVNDLVMPFIGLLTGTDFVNWFCVLKNPDGVDLSTIHTLEEATAAGLVTWNYGAFITAVINFIVMAFVIFILVKIINSVRNIGHKKVEEAPAAPTTKICPFCKSEIAIDATRCAHCTSEVE